MLTQKWFKNLDGCTECGTIEIPHRGYGLCQNCYARKHRKDNLEKARAYDKEYESRPEVKEKRKKYSQTDRRKQSVRKSTAKARSLHGEILLKRTREWRSKNPEKIKTYNDSRRDTKIARKYGKDALKKMIECSHACQKCGSTHRIAIHHIDWNPNNNNYENFAILCGICHGKLHFWVPQRLRREVFNEWMNTSLEIIDGESRVRNSSINHH